MFRVLAISLFWMSVLGHLACSDPPSFNLPTHHRTATTRLLSEPISSTQDPQVQFTYDVLYYVDHQANTGDPDGTPDRPFPTIQEAASRAIANKKQNRSTHILIKPGTYREMVNLATYTNYPQNAPDNATPILFEAETPGSVIISGSEIWSNWTYDAPAKLYVHDWPYDWGVYPNPTGGAREVADIVRRREMIFIDGYHLKQVLSKEELTPGSFFVDETAQQVLVDPPTDLDPTKALVEVGIQEILWQQEHEHHIPRRGLVFQHAATQWDDTKAAVRISGCKNVMLENIQMHWNNGRALYMGDSEKITLRQVSLNHNGWDGWGTWKIKGFYAEDTETSFNNWRGHWGQYYVWSVGNKLLTIHGLTLKRHRSEGNYARGLWLDLDNADVLLDSLTLINNLSDGVFIEANPGPIMLQNSRICGNGGAGILTANSEQVTLQHNIICNNLTGGIHVTGQDDGRPVANWVTGEPRLLFLDQWTLRNNQIFAQSAHSHELLQTTLGQSGWSQFINTLTSDENTWYHPDTDNVFEVVTLQIYKAKLNRRLDLKGWQAETGQDLNSVFPPSSPPENFP